MVLHQMMEESVIPPRVSSSNIAQCRASAQGGEWQSHSPNRLCISVTGWQLVSQTPPSNLPGTPPPLLAVWLAGASAERGVSFAEAAGTGIWSPTHAGRLGRGGVSAVGASTRRAGHRNHSAHTPSRVFQTGRALLPRAHEGREEPDPLPLPSGKRLPWQQRGGVRDAATMLLTSCAPPPGIGGTHG